MAVEQKAAGIAETADLDASAGNPAQAAREYAEASDLVQSNERFAVRAAEEFFKKDDYDAAWFYANRAVKASPRSKKSRIVAATILEARQDYEGALVHAEMAQTIDKEDAQVKKMVKRLAKEVR
jgi:lipopolysaccharide biosynthesis regulator YciM